jgi:ABC-type multidrug transport system ATPase subunit
VERARGSCTIILTTHIMEVAERLVGRIGIIQNGLAPTGARAYRPPCHCCS